MNNNVASPFNLQVPISSASPSGSNNTTTGRPPLWTPSSRRKVSRLYLYTTLPLEKIMAVVHAKSPDTPAPGKDSAHKTLNAMLNKQPRWLHPKTEDDMVRRLEELALSPTRTSSTHNSVASPTQASGPIPALNAIPTPHLVRDPGTRVSLEVPPFNQYPQQYVPNNGTAAQRQIQQNQEDNIYGKYSMTIHIPPLNRRGTSLSPISDEEPSVASWLNDRDAPVHLPMGPYYLPGNFLCLDEFAQYTCFPQDEIHQKLACFCRPIHEIEEPAWITAHGPTQTGTNALSAAIHGRLFEERDQFGHTALHLMAARFLSDYLFQAIISVEANDVLNVQNTAGQTLLHVLHTTWFLPQNQKLLKQLLDALAHKGFDFSARDCYGRSFSHILLLRVTTPELRNYALGLCSATSYQKRDAFNVTPTYSAIPEPGLGVSRASTQAMDVDAPVPMSRQASIADPWHFDDIHEETQLLKNINDAELNPRLEDNQGRNGLHCLAAATLSETSITQKYYLDENGAPIDRRRRRDKTVKNSDSCTDRLQFRLVLLQNLLDAGVDPNHYDIHGNTPLMAFVAQLPEDDDYKVGPDIIRELIDSGAQVNARNRSGETALHVAVRCGHKLAVKQLVESGACVHVRDAAGRSVLEVADVKMKGLRGHDDAEYAHLEACRAWLSGISGGAVQEPTVLQEWEVVLGDES
ncbi:ankyrin repeat domain-containing protein [Fusarium globosum]|uniref:Ankyrin repeat domain-containing protein n=1 Tax=Fusarium globosum TaxID=78864 RepID=A0A8H5YCT4_9HYPO|nr:ankyrin repeat domain-containing protein [Fusarium globosum]